MKKNFLSLVMALVAASLLQGHAVASAQSWTYPGEVAERPYYEGLGTEESPYLINSAQQLANLAWYVNNGTTYEGVCFALTADIDLNPGFTFNADGTVDGDGQPQAWVPVGYDWNHGIRFKGKFDGRGHTVRGLYLDLAYQCNGLFGAAEDSEIRSLNVTASGAYGDESSTACYCVGLVVGRLDNGLIAGCNSDGFVSRDMTVGVSSASPSYTLAGGIAGYLWGTASVTGCGNSATVQCTSIENGNVESITCVGGIVGYYGGSAKPVISDCSNSGVIYGSGISGGIVGYIPSNEGVVANLSNANAVYGVLASGGIIGDGSLAGISGCGNSGRISLEEGNLGVAACVGGIAGRLNMYGEMSECVNRGIVDFTNVELVSPKGGGLVGEFISSSPVAGCGNEGVILGCNCLGGLFGYSASSDAVFEDCYNSGLVRTFDVGDESYGGNVGGLIGRGSVGRLVRCCNVGKISGGDGYLSSGIASADVRLMDGCYNLGDVFGCCSYGLVSGTVTDISHCYNIGNINGLADDSPYDPKAAGLVYTVTGKILLCHNSGDVYSDKAGERDNCYVAGLCLNLMGDAEQCYNEGDVTGAYNCGGLFGVVSSSSVRNCYNVGKISGDGFVGGIASIYDCVDDGDEEIAGTYSYGSVGTSGLSGTGIVDIPKASIIGKVRTSDFGGPYETTLKFVNCYYPDLSANGDMSIGVMSNDFADTSGLTACPKLDFADGRICVLLNGGQDPAPWGQTVGVDPYPLLNGRGNPGDVGISLPETFDGRSLDGRAVYDLQGVRVYEPLESLHGIYIIGVRKVLLP